MKIFQIFCMTCFVFIFQKGFSQFKTAFGIQNDNIKVVYFEADQVSEIHLETHKQTTFNLNSSSEGFYKSDLYFNYQIKQDSLIIKSIYPKRLEFGDNKMTSTQVFSVSVDLKIPNHIKLVINSNLASVFGRGKFKYFQLDTQSGQCDLDGIFQNAVINTYNGSIKIATKDADIDAYSQNGSVDVYDFLIQENPIRIKTVNGDINVTQIE